MALSICKERLIMEKETENIKLLLDNEYSKIELSNGIMIATWKASIINLDIAKNTVISRLSVTGGQNFPVLIKIKSIKGSTKEARDFLSSEKGSEGVIAAAIYVDSIVGNMLATFFIYLNKPRIPTKIFKDEKTATKWLEQFVENDTKN